MTLTSNCNEICLFLTFKPLCEGQRHDDSVSCVCLESDWINYLLWI